MFAEDGETSQKKGSRTQRGGRAWVLFQHTRKGKMEKELRIMGTRDIADTKRYQKRTKAEPPLG